ncbi:S53 family peptidase [Angustibacter luteus]|uniref:Protease pro-enzyme activation domain-containing protein n=1 Tax=Angustibacter luteus TaxID=658456 RepID=A0ABW1JF38_9ACTN
MSPRLSIKVTAATAAALVAPTLFATTAFAAAGSGASRHAVANAQPDQVKGAKVVGTPSAKQQAEVRVFLAGRDQAGLAKAVAAVADPHSASYQHYLTAAQIKAAYAPSAASVARTKAFLKGYGLTIGEIPANNAYVTATGSLSQLQKAFGTTLHTYSVSGHTLRAASSAPSVPASLSADVIAVSGLASISQLMSTDRVGGPTTTHRTAKSATTKAPPPDAFVNATPCSTFYGQKQATTVPTAYGKVQPYAPCGYVPDQLEGAYGLTRSIAKGFDGRGVTVAITDAYAAPTILSDANTYATSHGQNAFKGKQFKQVPPAKPYRYGYDDTVNGDLCGEQGWYGEETLDVEAVHAMAPGANVTYVPGRSCDNADLLTAVNKVVARHLADIVTNSWGGTDESNGSPALDTAYQQVFYQAALEGIGVYFSSGDSGDGASDNNGVPTVQSPANSSLVTAVGGTSLAVSKTNTRTFETGWSTSKSTLTDGAWDPTPPGTYQYGGGGGTSQVFSQPAYQKGVVPASIAKRYSKLGGRAVPDVSALGDPNTGMRVGETQTFPDGTVKYSEYRIGGTSLASPLFAGMMAIADQVSGRPHGFANYALYDLYGTQAYFDPTHKANTGVVRVDYVNGVDDSDGLTTSLRTLDARNGTTIRTTAGYDDITGVGTPNGERFVGGLGVG